MLETFNFMDDFLKLQKEHNDDKAADKAQEIVNKYIVPDKNAESPTLEPEDPSKQTVNIDSNLRGAIQKLSYISSTYTEDVLEELSKCFSVLAKAAHEQLATKL